MRKEILTKEAVYRKFAHEALVGPITHDAYASTTNGAIAIGVLKAWEAQHHAHQPEPEELFRIAEKMIQQRQFMIMRLSKSALSERDAVKVFGQVEPLAAQDDWRLLARQALVLSMIKHSYGNRHDKENRQMVSHLGIQLYNSLFGLENENDGERDSLFKTLCQFGMRFVHYLLNQQEKDFFDHVEEGIGAFDPKAVLLASLSGRELRFPHEHLDEWEDGFRSHVPLVSSEND